jgi:hypothetical protein
MRLCLKLKSKLVILLAIAAVGRMAAAGRLEKVWEVPVTETGVTGRRSSDYAVYALSFAPDGHSIAAIVGRSWREESVLIMDSAAPTTNTKRLAINPAIDEWDPTNYAPILWTTSGQHIVLGHTLDRLSDGASCSLPPLVPAFFLTGSTLAGLVWLPHRHFALFGLDCQPTGTLEIPADGGILDASAERGLLCVRRPGEGGDLPATGVAWDVIDIKSGTSLHRPPPLYQARFADGGKLICGTGGEKWHQSVSCWDVDSGREISTSSKFTYVDLRTASQARRGVLSDYGRKLDWFIDWFWYPGSLKKRSVWDLETGTEIVSWRPKTQSVLLQERPYKPVEQPYRFAISPDGAYVVEGGAGLVSLYRIKT